MDSDHPLAQDLERRAATNPFGDPPHVETLPPSFEAWAGEVFQAGRLPVARLAGLLIARHRPERQDLAAELVLPLARLVDLPLLRRGLSPELRELVDELEQAANALPSRLGEALVVVAFRGALLYQGLAALCENVGYLERLRPRPGGLLSSLLAGVISMAHERDQEQEAARPRLEALQASARREAARLGQPHQLTTADVERAASLVDVPTIDLALLELAGAGPKHLPGLVVALALVRALSGTEHEDRWAGAFRERASGIIYALGLRQLFEMRVRLLDSLIERAEFPPSRWFFARANSRLNAAQRDTRDEALALRDMEAAMEAAKRDGDADALADATAAWAKVILTQPAPDPALVERTRELLEQAQALDLAPERRAAVLQARGYAVRLSHPRAAADIFDEASSLLSPDDSFRWELAAESISSLVFSGEHDRAAERARSLLAEAPAQSSATGLAMLRVEASEALIRVREPLGAVHSLLETALEQIRGRDPRMEATIQLRLARLELRRADVPAAVRHVSHAWDHEAAMDAATRTDALQVRAEVEAAGGKEVDAAASLARAVELAAGTPEEPLLRLQAAVRELEAGLTPQALDRLILEVVRNHDSRPDAIRLVEDIGQRHGDRLTPETLTTMTAWARARGNGFLEVRLRQHAEDDAGTREALRRALEATREPRERLACVALLVTLAEQGERAPLCDEIERLLGDHDDEPRIRMNLATALLLDSQDDRSRLLRAWRHGVRALRGLRDADAVHGRRTLASIVLRHARATLGRWVPERLELAGWLAEDHGSIAEELSGAQLELAYHLLVWGPLTSREVVDLARKLVSSAERHGGATDQVTFLKDRCDWIDASIGGVPWAGARQRALGPFDGAPAWFVALVAGRTTNVDPDPADGDALVPELLQLALDVRPDRADDVLAALVSSAARFSPEAGRTIKRLAREVVRGPGWSRVREAIDAAPPDTDVAPVAVVQRVFEEARSLMDNVRVDLPPSDAAERIARARSQLEEAVRLAREHDLPDLFNALVSLGNAWKTPPGEDLECALRFYDDAAALGGDDDQLARLWKVKADALFARGGADDLREAERLLDRSIERRRDWLRVESLASAARVAAVHPDLAEDERIVRAAELLTNAARTHTASAEALLDGLVRHLARWAQLRPNDERPHALVRELRRLYPARAAELTLHAPRSREALAQRLRRLLEHPATAAFTRMISELAGAESARPTSTGELQSWLNSQLEQALADPCRLERHLVRLEGEDVEDEVRPGQAVARVVLLAALTRHGRRQRHDVTSATTLAVEQAATVGDSYLRAALLRELARVWAPLDHREDPVRDFALAARLAGEAVEAEGGEDQASLESIEHLARALRYSPNAPPGRARRQYERLVERATNEGQADQLASALMGLAEVVSADGSGERAPRLREGAGILARAEAVARDPAVRARATAALAWQLTEAALAEGGPGQLAALQVAAETFDRAAGAHLSAQERRWLAGNRAVCASSLASGREEQVRLWRERVDAAASRSDRATAQHNLAHVFLSGRPTREEVGEAINLCEQAAPARADDPRHAYQTAMLAGTALSMLLDVELAPWSPAEVWARARGWLQQATVSARALGTGSELAQAGLALSRIACSAPTVEAFTETSEAAWEALGVTAPYLIFDRALSEQEAEAAAEVAVALARRLGAGTIAIASANIAFVLREDGAGSVLRWLRRASAPLRRPLRARLGAPTGVSIAQWQDWLAVVARREPLALVGALAGLRDVAPQFLAEDDEQLEATWRWLEARPGALAVNVLLARPVSIAALLSVDPSGQRRVFVLGLEVSPPPQDPESFAECMRAAACADGSAPESHAAMVAWARAGIVEPILGFHGERPSEVLWAPGRGLRGIAPSALWEGVPVSCAVSLDLPESAPRSRPRSTLVALGDPGPSTCGPAALGGAGRAALEEIADRARRAGRVRRLASCGSRFGAVLLGPAQDLRDRPSSAADILGEAREHDVVVLIAHGEAPTPEDAAVLCVSESGGVDRLDVAALGRSPDAFCGATVVLLSCETGRIGDALAEPGGVAGALLAAGARAVVAPLWPVRLDVAVEVAREVLDGLHGERGPAVALARLRATHAQGGPTLGPAPPVSAQRAASALQRQAFVTWVG